MKKQEYSDTQRNVLLDEFITPIELVEACIRTAVIHKFLRHDRIYVTDVGANDGRWGKTIRKYFPNAVITGIEVMNMPKPEGFNYWITGDFMEYVPPIFQDLYIGNIPFCVREIVMRDGEPVLDDKGNPVKRIVYKAEDFIWRAFKYVSPLGHIMYLMRSNYRHSIERYWRSEGVPGIHQEHHYKECYNFTRRPSYYREDKRTEGYGTSNTNAHDNSFFTFSRQWKENWGKDYQLDWQYAD